VGAVNTIAELVAQANAGEILELEGLTYEGADVDVWPEGLILRDGTFTGQTQVFDARGGGFDSCSFTGAPGVKQQGLLRMRGGIGWAVTGCGFSGGIQAGQLSISLNDRLPMPVSIPRNWVVSGCDFRPPVGQWGTYPATTHVYVLSDPTYSQNGVIDGCYFWGHPFGPNVKVGGTGNNPRTEGARGVEIRNCTFNGVPGRDGRANTMLVEGAKSEATVIDSKIQSPGWLPYLQAVDGARLRMQNVTLPQGVTEMSSWYFLYFWTQSKKVTVAPGVKPPTVGGISWA
jgi:hypothetical protein